MQTVDRVEAVTVVPAGTGAAAGRRPAAGLDHVEALLRSGLELDVDRLGELLGGVSPHVDEVDTFDAALTATLAFLEPAPGKHALGDEIDEVLRARASRLTDLRAPDWRSAWRTACTALVVGYVLGWAGLDGEPSPPHPDEPRWWYLISGANLVQETVALADHPVLGPAVDRLNQQLFAGREIAHRAMVDGVAVAVAQALVEAGGIAARQ